MRADEVLRAARGQAGLSQRAAAAAAGVSVSSLADAEAGRRQPAWGTVALVVQACGLDLGLVRPGREIGPEAAALLAREDPAWRFAHALGDPQRVSPWLSPRLRELRELARWTRLVLRGRSAIGFWVWGHAPDVPLVVDAPYLERFPPLLPRPTCASVELSHPAMPAGDDCWHLRLGGYALAVQDPLSLALGGECDDVAGALRDVATHLDRTAARDRQQRRPPAHRVGELKSQRPR